MLDSVTCEGRTVATCTGVERGTNIAMESTCSLRGDGSANWCKISFNDNRYVVELGNRGLSNEVGIEITEDTGTADEDEVPAGERPPAGWTCMPSTEGQYGCDCDVVNVGGTQGSTRTVCTSPFVTTVADPGGETVTETRNEDGTITQEATRDDDVCSLIGGNLGECLASIVAKVGASVLFLFVSVFGVLLGLFGVIFNWVVLVTVFQYATYFGNSEGLLVAWSVLRDLGNIFLLFGFIFIGLQTILNIGHFSVGKALPRLLIFAILINFSLLVSSAIVDTANVFSAALYSGVGEVNCGNAEAGAEPEECTGIGIAAKIQAAAGLGNIMDRSGSIQELWGADDGVGMFITYFGLLLLIIIMMIVFLAASIMLLIRAITLMFLLVLSPLGFAATAIPQFEEYSKMWWNKLLSQAFFAPMFLLMLFTGLKIMDGANATFNSTGASLTTAFASGQASAGGIFILFMLVIGFMIGSLMVASRLGAMGASFATRQAGNVVMGGMARVGRHTVGRNMHKWAEARKSTAKDRTGFSKLMYNTVAAGGKASFDARTTGAVGAIAKAGHLDFGKGKTGGYTKILHDEEKSHMDYAKDLKNTPEELAQIEALKKQIGNADTAYKALTDEMRTRHKADKELVRALEDIKNLSGQARAARERGQIDEKAESALSNAYRQRDDKVAEQKQELDEAKRAYEKQVEIYKVGEDGKSGIKGLKEKPQRDYAANIGHPGPILSRTVFGEAGEHAGHKIIKELDKTEMQKLTDALKDAKGAIAAKPKEGGKDEHAADH